MSVTVKAFFGVSFANCYAIEIGGEIALVDIGDVSDGLMCYLKGREESVKYILLTHDHFDHILGVESILEVCPNAKVVIHKNDASGLQDSRYSLTSLVGVAQPNITPDVLVVDGDKLPLSNLKLEVLHTPGHTDGSVCYIIEDNIFSGDTLFEGTCGRTDFITGSYENILNSLKILAQYPKHYKVYAGHGNITTIENELKFNPYLKL